MDNGTLLRNPDVKKLVEELNDTELDIAFAKERVDICRADLQYSEEDLNNLYDRSSLLQNALIDRGWTFSEDKGDTE